mgnify:CR=1 FL=1
MSTAKKLGLAGLVLVVAAGAAVWWFVIRDTAPPEAGLPEVETTVDPAAADFTDANGTWVAVAGPDRFAGYRIEELFGARGYDAMVSLRDQGVVRAIGGGINEWEVCQTLAERGDFDLFLLAGRYTLLEQTALDSFLPLCESRGIGIVTGGPYNSGILATGAKPGAFYNYDPAPAEILDRVNRIEAVCKDHGVAMVDAAFQFPLLHPAHVAVIPGGQGVSEMAGNLKAAQAEIPRDLWADLKAQGLMREDAPT